MGSAGHEPGEWAETPQGQFTDRLSTRRDCEEVPLLDGEAGPGCELGMSQGCLLGQNKSSPPWLQLQL